MQLGKVVGSVVSTQKDPGLEGMKLLLVRLLHPDLRPAGAVVVAVDSVEAGPDEIVLVVQGSSARQTPLTQGKAVDALIMAVVDSFDLDGRVAFRKHEYAGDAR